VLKSCPIEGAQFSDPEPSPALEIDAVRRRLGMELRRSLLSLWVNLNRSTAPYSDGFRTCPVVLPGVEGGMLPRDGDDAIEDVEVAGDGGLAIMALWSRLVTTLGGFFSLCDTLRLREWNPAGSENAWERGVI